MESQRWTQEELSHWEDEATERQVVGGVYDEVSDLAALRHLLESQADRQEQRWRSLQLQIHQLRQKVEADRQPPHAPSPAVPVAPVPVATMSAVPESPVPVPVPMVVRDGPGPAAVPNSSKKNQKQITF